MNENFLYDLNNMASQYCQGDVFIGAEPYGNGLINDTFSFYYRQSDGKQYRILIQRINDAIFTDPEGLMNNIVGVTTFLKKKIAARGGDIYRETLNVIPTTDGKTYYRDPQGNYWRAYIFIEHTLTSDKCTNDSDYFTCGHAFGAFQYQLSDYPAETLIEPIPHFHDTPDRVKQLETAVKENAAGRADSVKDEIEFVLSRKEKAGQIAKWAADGLLPLRVSHNDTKLNNILIDATTKKGLCVIDLDTVMPGYICYDFGDMIRFGANTTYEDDKDLSNVSLDLHKFELFAEGYLSIAKDFLNPTEAMSLAVGAVTITYECGCRFLTDYLNGDKYFKTLYPEHNLVRCRNQFKLVADMEQKLDEMQRIVAKYYNCK